MRARLALVLLAAAALAGCASHRTRNAPAPPEVVSPADAPPAATQPHGAQIAGYAAALVGTPYRFGGTDGEGFDCSGLAVYVYGLAGIAIPRTAAEQQRAAFVIPTASLQPGDLVFFRIQSRHHVDHVGIYSGAGKFIHAPRPGQPVAMAALDAGYFAQHLAGAGRFVPALSR